MISRRRLLTTSTAALSATIAGCLGVLDNDDEDDNGNDTSNQNGTENGNETSNGDDANGDENGEENGNGATPDSSYTDWLAADIVGEYWTVITLNPARVAEIEGVENLGFADEIDGIENSDIDQVVILSEGGLSEDAGTFVVSRGNFDTKTVLEGFRDTQVEGELVEEGSYHEYDLYSDTGVTNNVVFGVQDGLAAFATSREILESSIDAQRGEATRLHEADQRFQQFTETLSVSDRLSLIALDSFDGAALANGYDYAPDESSFELVVDHTSSDAASSLADQIDTELADLALVDPTVNVDGELVTVTAGESNDRINNNSPGQALVGTVMTELGFTGPQPSPVPQVSFNSEYDSEADELTITHMSGDMFTAGQVSIGGTGSPDTDSTWADLSSADDVTPTTQIGAGSTVTLQSVDADYDIELVWTSVDGETTETLATFQGPEA